MPAPSADRASRVTNTLVALGATLVAMAMAEVAVRATDREPAAIYERDSTFLYRLVPGSHKYTPLLGRRVYVEVDSFGFRGAEITLRSPALRIAVFGDSFIAGEYSPLAETFVDRLRVEVRRHLRDTVETVNLGVAGFGPDQSLLRMRREFERLKPDLAIIALFPMNDYGDFLRNKLFALDSAGALIPRGGQLSDSMTAVFEETARPTGWRRSHLARMAARSIQGRYQRWRPRAGPPVLEFTRKALSAGDSTLAAYDVRADTLVGREIFRDEYDADIAITPTSRTAVREVALMAATLRAMRIEAERAGVPLVVIVIPGVEDVCLTNERHIDSASFPTYDRRRLTDTAERLAREAGLPVLNFWDPFTAAGSCSLYWGRSDNHWNTKGQALAARLLADTLSARHLLPAAARQR